MKSLITTLLAFAIVLVLLGCGHNTVSDKAGEGKEHGPDDKSPGASAAHGARDRSTTAFGDQPPSELERAALEGMRKMIADGKDLNSADNEEKVPPLFQAAERSHLHVVKLLLQKDADPNVKTSFGESPLHIACRRGNPRIVQLLLERGAVPDGPGGGEGFTPLHQAALGGHPDIMRMLLIEGADVRRKSNRDETLVHMAAVGGHVEAMKLALANELKVGAANNEGKTPLHLAAYFNHDEMIALLLQNGADLEAKDSQGQTPLHAAAQGEKIEKLPAAVEEPGKERVTKDLSNPTPPAAKAAERDKQSSTGELREFEMTEARIDRLGRIMNFTHQRRESEFDPWITETYQVVVYESAVATRKLLDKGANVNARDKSGRTPLDLATEINGSAGQHERVAEILRQHGGKKGTEMQDPIR